ncbi:MerR family transcriptional regulator [Deinococcus roseus]|uniref:MerR family transcriptional regulator n=1 Tax=Deinococcus roseus TaxID=392414 RepID=A0ABQ2CUW0_9DEIO|nr:MerR family transcriptional regulator [Deinococcus roseus]GGJ23094.1 MerR family transcriptional regulator [Deinococcus roseus]
MNETRADLLTISAFARNTRLSQKALRLYDAMGLLIPVFVDPQSGYRYYHASQFEAAHLIGLLRQLEMPLNRIFEVLQASEDQRATLVRSYWREVEQDARQKKELVQYLSDYLEKKENHMFDIQTRTVPAAKIITIQQRVYASDLPAFIGEAFGRIMPHLEASDAPITAAPFVIYHGTVNQDSDGPVEVCVPFMGPVEPLEGMNIRIEPEHPEAFTTITKGQCVFPEILKAYDAVSLWLREQGRMCSMLSSREVYFANWDEAGPDDLVCDIAFPY